MPLTMPTGIANSAAESHDDERAQDRVRHASARFADGLRHLGEETPAQRRDALRQHVEQHEGQRDEGDQHRQDAQPDDDVRKQPTPAIPHHVALSAAGITAVLTGRACRCRAIDQMNNREMALMMSVITKSTRPISTRAFR